MAIKWSLLHQHIDSDALLYRDIPECIAYQPLPLFPKEILVKCPFLNLNPTLYVLFRYAKVDGGWIWRQNYLITDQNHMLRNLGQANHPEGIWDREYLSVDHSDGTLLWEDLKNNLPIFIEE